MAKLKELSDVDPEVAQAAEERDRIAAAHSDGLAAVEQLEAAEGRLSLCISAAERRRERDAAIERERSRTAKTDAERVERWRSVATTVAERMAEREASALRLERAFAEVVDAVAEWEAIPPLSPLLVDAPPVIAKRNDVNPLASAFVEAMRPAAGALGLGHVPLPPKAFRAPLAAIIAKVHEPVWNALEAEQAKP